VDLTIGMLFYFITEDGTVLTAIEQGIPYRVKPIQALIEARNWWKQDVGG